MIEQKIIDLLLEKFKEEDYEDYYVVDVEINNTKLNVYIDCDSGLSLGKCQKISRYLEGHLDEQLWLGERYTLEVSSPGTDRPLKFLRQYKKNIGRTAEVHLRNESDDGEREIKKGKIISVKEDKIALEAKVKKKEGKKNKTITQVTSIPFETIEKTIIKISFK